MTVHATQESTEAAHNNLTQKMMYFCSDCVIHCSTGARIVYPKTIANKVHIEADRVHAGATMRGLERQGGTSSSEDVVIYGGEQGAGVRVTVGRKDHLRRAHRCGVVPEDKVGAEVGRGGVARDCWARSFSKMCTGGGVVGGRGMRVTRVTPVPTIVLHEGNVGEEHNKLREDPERERERGQLIKRPQSGAKSSKTIGSNGVAKMSKVATDRDKTGNEARLPSASNGEVEDGGHEQPKEGTE